MRARLKHHFSPQSGALGCALRFYLTPPSPREDSPPFLQQGERHHSRALLASGHSRHFALLP
eukprot:10250339-Prorocentrum_lima.AAC.1